MYFFKLEIDMYPPSESAQSILNRVICVNGSNLIGMLQLSYVKPPKTVKTARKNEVQRILTKPLLQNRHRCTASKSSSTIHVWVTVGSSLCAEGGRKAFRLHPTHVRTHGVDKINVVTEHRARYHLSFNQEQSKQDTRQLCPLPQTAVVMSFRGTCTPQAGQTSLNWLAISNEGVSFVDIPVSTRCWTRLERFLPSSDRSGGDPGRRDCTTIRETKGISLAIKIKGALKHPRISVNSERDVTC